MFGLVSSTRFSMFLRAGPRKWLAPAIPDLPGIFLGLYMCVFSDRSVPWLGQWAAKWNRRCFFYGPGVVGMSARRNGCGQAYNFGFVHCAIQRPLSTISSDWVARERRRPCKRPNGIAIPGPEFRNSWPFAKLSIRLGDLGGLYASPRQITWSFFFPDM